MVAFGVVLVLSACSKPKKSDGKSKRPEKPILQSVEFGGGSTTIYKSADANSPISFTTEWEKGDFKAGNKGIETGKLITVSGDLYANGKKGSNYRADRGDAVAETKRLTLSGDVVLRSADGSQTLRAPKVEYRGDVGLVRATGGVTAAGSFGTLSGVPELWATPDLRLIGTPDMVSKMLGIPALVALAATAPVANPVIQSESNYILTGGRSSAIKRLPSGGTQVTLVPLKPGTPFHLVAKAQGLNLYADGQVIAIVDSKGKFVQSATTRSKVKVIQDATETTKDGSVVRHTEYEGPGADYRYDEGKKLSNIDLGGPVQMTSVAQETTKDGLSVTTMKGRGDRGVVILDASASATDARRLTLTGNVKLDLLEVNPKGEKQKATASGDKLEYRADEKAGKVLLTGKSVDITGDGLGTFGQVTDVDTATIILDAKNQWTDISFDNTSGGGTTTTATPPPPKTKPKKGGPR